VLNNSLTRMFSLSSCSLA